MSEPRDELDALRDAWRELDPPVHAQPGNTLPEDDATRACVDWMRSAWNALEAPEPAQLAAPDEQRSALARPLQPVQTVQTGPSLRTRVLRSTLPFAAAACAVLLLELAQRPSPWSRPGSRSGRAVELAQAEPIRPIVRANGSLEMRSGEVRLILLPDPVEATRAGDPEHSSPETDR